MLEGLPPHNPTHIMRVATDERRARLLTELLGEISDPAETAVSCFEAADAASWSVEAYFAAPPDEAALRDWARTLLGEDAEGLVFETLARTDWVQASLAGLKPVRAGRFLVHGGHDRDAVRPNDLALEIEAALAFGTGHHGTTQGCLLALAAELKRRRPRHVLDVGTGTGILAFAAAKMLKGGIVAGDIDAEAIRVARGNAALNGVRPAIRLYTAPGTRHPLADRARRFDLVTANILARPLARLAPRLARVLAPGGTLILSGLLDRDVPGIVTAYRHQGLALARRASLEGWATLVLGRGGAAPRPIS